MIDHYPKKGMFADISDVSYGVGGCAANTAVGVKALDPSIDVNKRKESFVLVQRFVPAISWLVR